MPAEKTNDKSYLICENWWPRSAPSTPLLSFLLPGLILGWQLAIVSVCGRDSNEKQLLTESESSHEKPFSLKEIPTKASESQWGPIQCLRVIDVPCEECSPPCIPEHSDRSTGDMKMTPCGSLLHDKTVGPNFESTFSVLLTTLLCWRQGEGRTRGSFSSDQELW